LIEWHGVVIGFSRRVGFGNVTVMWLHSGNHTLVGSPVKNKLNQLIEAGLLRLFVQTHERKLSVISLESISDH